MKTTLTISALLLSGCIVAPASIPTQHAIPNAKPAVQNYTDKISLAVNLTDEDETQESVVQEPAIKDVFYGSHNLGEPITQTTGTATWHGTATIETWTQGESYNEPIAFDIDFAGREIDGATEIQRRPEQPLMIVHFGGQFDEHGNLTGLASESSCRHNDYVRIAQSCWFNAEYDFRGGIGKDALYGEFSRSDITARSGVHGYINGSFIASPK